MKTIIKNAITGETHEETRQYPAVTISENADFTKNNLETRLSAVEKTIKEKVIKA